MVLRRGFVDTAKGLLLRGDEVMKLVEKTEDFYRRKNKQLILKKLSGSRH